eukprot:9489347-Pyramimonas_sp.AAC.1
MPLTLPFGLVSAVSCPRRNASATGPGSLACAILVAAWCSELQACSSSRSVCKCSPVKPDGPGAAPLRQPRRLRRSLSDSSKIGSGAKAARSPLSGSRGWASLRAGSRSSASVASVPGARALAVRAWRAAETSPCCTK